MKEQMSKVARVRQGSLLISEPFLPDPNFKRKVVLLCEHNTEGTVGFILDNPLEVSIQEAIPDFPEFDAKLFIGGPVQTDTLHFIHDVGDMLEGSTKVLDGVYWGGNFEALKILIDTGQVTPANFRFFLGYSGWGAGQLRHELRDKSWIVTEGSREQIFKEKPDDLWKKVLRNMGKEYAIVSNFPEDPSLN